MNKKDIDIISNITIEMAKAQSAKEIMTHWSKDVEWFDITARHLIGFDSVYKEFDEQFSALKSCGAEIVSLNAKVNGDFGIVTTQQHFWYIKKNCRTKNWFWTRQTDFYEKRNEKWELTHQHVSLCLNDMN